MKELEEKNTQLHINICLFPQWKHSLHITKNVLICLGWFSVSWVDLSLKYMRQNVCSVFQLANGPYNSNNCK